MGHLYETIAPCETGPELAAQSVDTITGGDLRFEAAA